MDEEVFCNKISTDKFFQHFPSDKQANVQY